MLKEMLMIVEGGGWGDAVMPLISPNGTAGEWFEDPYGTLGYTFSGPGKLFSLPAKNYVVHANTWKVSVSLS